MLFRSFAVVARKCVYFARSSVFSAPRRRKCRRSKANFPYKMRLLSKKSYFTRVASSRPLPVKKGFGNTRRRFRIPSQKYNSLHYTQSATTTTAASGGNREELLGQRPARRACRSRHDADAGSRNPASGGHFKSSRIKQGRRTKYCAAAGVRMRYAKYSCARRAASLMQSRSWSSVSNFLLGLR